jgi:hypothetical protein
LLVRSVLPYQVRVRRVPGTAEAAGPQQVEMRSNERPEGVGMAANIFLSEQERR